MTLEAALSSKKAFDAYMDDEFVFLAHFIRFYKERVSCEDEPKCVAWLQRLLSPTRDGTSRLVRNTYLAELLVAMQSGVLGGPFAKMPPEGPLALADLGQNGADVGEVGEPPWLDTVMNAPVRGDQQDERTYIATEVPSRFQTLHSRPLLFHLLSRSGARHRSPNLT